jgi:hypothetical protein
MKFYLNLWLCPFNILTPKSIDIICASLSIEGDSNPVLVNQKVLDCVNHWRFGQMVDFPTRHNANLDLSILINDFHQPPNLRWINVPWPLVL